MRAPLIATALLLACTTGQARPPHELRYRIEELQTAVGTPNGINLRGDIAGQGYPLPQAGPETGFLWKPHNLLVFDEDPSVRVLALNGVNDARWVVGAASVATPNGPVTRGFVWHHGHYQFIDDLPGGFNGSGATSINNRGQVAGYSQDQDGSTCLLWENGNAMPLTPPPFTGQCAPWSINDAGEIVGDLVTEAHGVQPFAWEEGVMRLLPVPEGFNGIAIGVNKHGHIAGYYDQGTGIHAGVWRDDRLTELVGPVGYQANVTAMAINDSDQVVGTAANAIINSEAVAVTWIDGAAYNLNDLIAPNDPLKSCVILQGARVINNSGVIGAYGTDQCSNTGSRLFRLTPHRR